MKFEIKHVLKGILAISIVVMLVMQIAILREFNTIRMTMQHLQSQVNSVGSQISNQTYTFQQENALYHFSGIEFEDVKVHKTPGIINMKLYVGFDKLPADANVQLAYRGTSDSLEKNEQAFDPVQTATLLESAPNVYFHEANFDVGKNYELSIIVNGNNEQVKEIIGVLPILEWSENPYGIQAKSNFMGVTTPDNGRFGYTIELFNAPEYKAYYPDHGVAPFKSLYDFNQVENPFGMDVVEATYRIYYDNLLIKEGKLEQQESVEGYWQSTGETPFKADINSDYSRLFRIEVDTLTSSGILKTYSTSEIW